MKDNLAIALVILLLIFCFVGFIFLYGYAVASLWNYIMPYLFGLPTINTLQAIAMGTLISCLKGVTITHAK